MFDTIHKEKHNSKQFKHVKELWITIKFSSQGTAFDLIKISKCFKFFNTIITECKVVENNPFKNVIPDLF